MTVTLKRNALIEDYLSKPDGTKVPYFADFKEELGRMQKDAATLDQTPQPSAEQKSNALVYEKMKGMDVAVDKIFEVFINLKYLMHDYDNRLTSVVTRHEEDFLTAYKTHMVKVEQQMQLLKDKAQEQENKLNNDDRILKMEKHLGWCRNEFHQLLQAKERNQHELDEINDGIAEIESE